jgi:hypothetical protein
MGQLPQDMMQFIVAGYLACKSKAFGAAPDHFSFLVKGRDFRFMHRYMIPRTSLNNSTKALKCSTDTSPFPPFLYIISALVECEKWPTRNLPHQRMMCQY